jgi:hypothetical protein
VVPSSSTVAPMLLQLLLDPKSIERLLLFGGGLSVLGLIAWLISLGVFEDKCLYVRRCRRTRFCGSDAA